MGASSIAPRGEKVGVLQNALPYIRHFWQSSPQGIVILLSGQTQGDGSGTRRGIALVKVSFGIFDSCFKLPSSSDHPASDPTHCQGAKGKHTRYVVPLYN